MKINEYKDKSQPNCSNKLGEDQENIMVAMFLVMVEAETHTQ